MTSHIIYSHDLNKWPTNFILTSSHHRYYHICHHSHVMTTSESLICYTTITSSHHHGTRHLLSKDLVWALSRMLWRLARETTSRSTSVLESGGSSLIEKKCPWLLLAWLRGSALSCYNKKTIKGATSEVVRENGWPDAAWPDFLRR